MKQKGFAPLFVIVIIAVSFALLGYGYYQKQDIVVEPPSTPEQSPTPSATPTPASTPLKTPVATKKPVATATASPAASDCSRFDKTKKAKVTVNVKTEVQPYAGSVGWILYLKPGGDCPGQTLGGVTLIYVAETGTSATNPYTSPDLVPGQYRLDVTSASRKSIGVTIDVPEGQSTQNIEVK